MSNADEEPKVYEYSARVIKIIAPNLIKFKVIKYYSADVDYGLNMVDKIRIQRNSVALFKLRNIWIPGEVRAEAMSRVREVLSIGKIKVATSGTLMDNEFVWLATVYIEKYDSEVVCLNSLLLDEGLAKPMTE
jgi:hypothetical protein